MKNLYKKIIHFLLIVLLSSQFIYASDTGLQFKSVELSDVLTELSKFYSINFIYHDELIEGKKVTYNISKQNSEAAIQEMLKAFNLSFEIINKNTYVLYQKIQSNPVQTKKMTTQIESQKAPVLTPPKAISKIQIPYPDIAKEKGFEGSIEMDILIDENGNVKTVKIQKSSDSDILDQAAMEYAKKIKFLPAQIDSQSISVWSKWKVIFDLVPSDTTFSEVVFKNIENN
jgi:TonB family protein